MTGMPVLGLHVLAFVSILIFTAPRSTAAHRPWESAKEAEEMEGLQEDGRLAIDESSEMAAEEAPPQQPHLSFRDEENDMDDAAYLGAEGTSRNLQDLGSHIPAQFVNEGWTHRDGHGKKRAHHERAMPKSEADMIMKRAETLESQVLARGNDFRQRLGAATASVANLEQALLDQRQASESQHSTAELRLIEAHQRSAVLEQQLQALNSTVDNWRMNIENLKMRALRAHERESSERKHVQQSLKKAKHMLEVRSKDAEKAEAALVEASSRNAELQAKLQQTVKADEERQKQAWKKWELERRALQGARQGAEDAAEEAMQKSADEKNRLDEILARDKERVNQEMQNALRTQRQAHLAIKEARKRELYAKAQKVKQEHALALMKADEQDAMADKAAAKGELEQAAAAIAREQEAVLQKQASVDNMRRALTLSGMVWGLLLLLTSMVIVFASRGSPARSMPSAVPLIQQVWSCLSGGIPSGYITKVCAATWPAAALTSEAPPPVILPPAAEPAGQTVADWSPADQSPPDQSPPDQSPPDQLPLTATPLAGLMLPDADVVHATEPVVDSIAATSLPATSPEAS